MELDWNRQCIFRQGLSESRVAAPVESRGCDIVQHYWNEQDSYCSGAEWRVGRAYRQ